MDIILLLQTFRKQQAGTQNPFQTKLQANIPENNLSHTKPGKLRQRRFGKRLIYVPQADEGKWETGEQVVVEEGGGGVR